MSRKPNYWWSAFNARPLGMPIPPNWLGLAAFGLLGVFLSPGFWVLGAGAEIAYLAWLGGNRRFRTALDLEAGIEETDPVDARYVALLATLDAKQRKRQEQVEERAREILARLAGSSLLSTHADSLQQLVWLHLRLLAARQAVAEVVATSQRERDALEKQEAQLTPTPRAAASTWNPNCSASTSRSP